MKSIFTKKKDDEEKRKTTVVCSKDFIKDVNYIKSPTPICQKDLQHILELVIDISKGKTITENIYKIRNNSIQSFHDNLNEGNYKNFIKSIKDILFNPDYYLGFEETSDNNITESKSYTPKNFFKDFITNISPVLITLLSENIDEITSLIEKYNEIEKKGVPEFLINKRNEWFEKRNELDNLCNNFEHDAKCNKNIDLDEIIKNIENINKEKSSKQKSLKLPESQQKLSMSSSQLQHPEQNSKKDSGEFLLTNLPPPPPPPILNTEQPQPEQPQLEQPRLEQPQLEQPVSPDVILKQYVETFKKIYFEPFFYQIVSLDINDFVSLFNSENTENRITINYLDTDNKKYPYNYDDLFSVLFSFIYVDITPFYNLITDETEKNNPSLSQLVDKSTIDKINFDTNKANEILKKRSTNVTNNKKYLFIKNFYEIIEKTVILDFEDIKYIFVYLVSLIGKTIKNTIELYKRLKQNSSYNKDAYNKLEEILSNKSSDMVLTFLKINNFENNIDKTNKRFKIDYKNMEENKLVLKYNDDNIKYYDTTDRNNIKVNTNAEITLKKDYNIAKYTDYFTVSEKKYKNQYNLGPFSKIFNFDKNNEQIASELKIVQNLLEREIPVFIIGYGASGAGKTSSLIYNKNDGQNGIIVHLCNIMARKGFYNNVELKSREFYAERLNLQGKNNENKNTIVRQIPENNNVISFEYKDGEFKLTKDYKHINKHKKETDSKNFIENTKIGEILEYIIDTDRLVFATTNNPNSSRSHSLSFLKFINNENGKEVTLIVGDFAGVENIFNCEDPETIKKFNEIKGKSNSYYTEVKDEESDALSGNGISFPEPHKKINDLEKNKKNHKFNLYNKFFENETMSEYIKIESGLNISITQVIDSIVKNLFIENNNINDFYKNFKSEFEKKYILEQGKKGKKDKPVENGQNILEIPIDEYKKYVKYYVNKIVDNAKYVNLIDKAEEEKRNTEIKVLSEKKQYKYIENICRLRRNEGFMINKSLEEVRKIIKYILIYKNKDRINISPPFIKECIDFYCSKDKCFPLDRGSKYDFEKLIPFTIFREIYDNLDKDKFLKIVISVFCVLNISRVANNPPPVPYIDINIMKKLYYNPPNNDYTEFIKEFKRFFEKDTSEKFKNPPLSYFETDFSDKNNENIFSKDAVNNVETIKINDIFQNANIESGRITTVNEDNKNIIEIFFELINKFNASSAIGTLDFLDQLAKFNTINSICKLDKLNL